MDGRLPTAPFLGSWQKPLLKSAPSLKICWPSDRADRGPSPSIGPNRTVAGGMAESYSAAAKCGSSVHHEEIKVTAEWSPGAAEPNSFYRRSDRSLDAGGSRSHPPQGTGWGTPDSAFPNATK